MCLKLSYPVNSSGQPDEEENVLCSKISQPAMQSPIYAI